MPSHFIAPTLRPQEYLRIDMQPLRVSQKMKEIKTAASSRPEGSAIVFQKLTAKLQAQKKGQTFRSDLEEAATYSPTGKPQYHRRK